MAPGYAVAVMGIDFTLRYFYKVLLDLLPICNQDKGKKIRYELFCRSCHLLLSVADFDSCGFNKSVQVFCWAGAKLAEWWEEKREGGRRDKLIITAFQLGMWRCCCLSPHTFPSFMPPFIFCPPASLIVPNSSPLSLPLLSVGVQQPYKSGLAP